MGDGLVLHVFSSLNFFYLDHVNAGDLFVTGHKFRLELQTVYRIPSS